MTTSVQATYQRFTVAGAHMPETINFFTKMEPTPDFLVRLARHFVSRRYRGQQIRFVVTRVEILDRD